MADPTTEPVQVCEAIPVAGAHQIDPALIQSEGIPTPDDLFLMPELGRGVAGRIHTAIDRYLLRKVALKRLSKDLAQHPFYRDGFVAEAQIAGQLEHPNIVPVYELGQSAGKVPYFTMKLVQGVSLSHWLRGRAPGSSERLEGGLEIFLKVCEAIAYAHDRGVVHRDLKPDNVMEAEGAVGTPPFMAPEQARGNPKEMDERTDVFGLGAILYQIVSGRLPYGPLRPAQEILELAKAGQVVPIDQALGNLPVAKRIRQIVMRALSRAPADRYQSVPELAADVRRFLRGGLHLPTKTFAPGDVVIREGDVGDAAYMIASGTCRAFRTVDGREETLATMGAGDVFGVMALLLYEPRAATVVAVDEVTLLVLDKQTLSEGLGIDGWTGALVRALAHRIRDLEQQVRASGMRRT